MKPDEIERIRNNWAQMSDETFASLKREDFRAELQPHFDRERIRRGQSIESGQNDSPSEPIQFAASLDVPTDGGDKPVRVESGFDNFAGIRKNVMSRYWDAYLVARATIGIGGVVKGIAICVAIIVILVGFVASSEAGSPVLIVAGILIAILFGTPVFVMGILVSAQGQTLKASLDSAVNTSTFLDNEQRAKVMSLA